MFNSVLGFFGVDSATLDRQPGQQQAADELIAEIKSGIKAAQ